MQPKNTTARWALIGLEIVGGLIAIPWLPLGLFISCFIFDAPDSGGSLFAWLAWLLAVGWPWMFLAASLKAWKLYGQGRALIGVLLLAVTLAPAGCIFGALAITFANEGIPVEERWARIKKATANNTFTEPLQRRLAESISRGDVAAMESALRDGADVEGRGKHGLTMLLWAVAKRNVPAFELLLKSGAVLDADLGESFYNTWGGIPKTVIEQIVIDDDPGFLRAAIDHGLAPDYIPAAEQRETLLQLAVKAGAEKNVELLLDEGADVNHMSEYGGPPIVDAFSEDRYDMVLLLVSREANAAMANRWGRNIADLIRVHGTRRVRKEQLADYARVVEMLRRRGQLSDAEARDAFTPKQPGSPPPSP
jgi:uncharacterized protein